MRNNHFQIKIVPVVSKRSIRIRRGFVSLLWCSSAICWSNFSFIHLTIWMFNGICKYRIEKRWACANIQSEKNGNDKRPSVRGILSLESLNRFEFRIVLVAGIDFPLGCSCRVTNERKNVYEILIKRRCNGLSLPSRSVSTYLIVCPSVFVCVTITQSGHFVRFPIRILCPQKRHIALRCAIGFQR